jgi:tetratricopeptide (TPR) repeat protein
MLQQLDGLLGKILEASSKATDSIKQKNNGKKVDSTTVGNNVVINIDPTKGYNEMERDLLANCPAIKRILNNTKETSENSISSNPKALDFYNEGLDYYEARNWKKALNLFDKAVKEDKKFAFAWDMKGIAHRQLEEFKDAISAYKKSLKIDPNGKMPLQNLPVSYSYLGEYKNAANAYTDLLNRYPGDPEAYYGLGQCGINLKDDDMAIDNMMIAYTIYTKTNSPYKQDAATILARLYNEMKEKGKLDTFMKYAQKHDIKFAD